MHHRIARETLQLKWGMETQHCMFGEVWRLCLEKDIGVNVNNSKDSTGCRGIGLKLKIKIGNKYTPLVEK